MNSLKKNIYITSFVFFGALLGFFLHMLIEIFYISKLLLANYTLYSLGLSWRGLAIAHVLVILILMGGGAVTGFLQGRYWWNIIYIEKRFLSLFRKKR